MSISRKFRRQSEVYKMFGEGDFSDESLKEMYEYESNGVGDLKIGGFSQTPNGYAVGKKNLNITVSMWMDTLRGRVVDGYHVCYGWANLITDLYCDKFPKWWLGSVFKEFFKQKDEQYKSLGREGWVKAHIKLAKRKRKLCRLKSQV